MSDPFTGEIRMFGGNFAPRSWALCDGQLMQVSQNDALFSLFGTIYGGDGRTTFALPDLRSRVPIHMGQGPGLTDRRLGVRSGSEQASVSASQSPSHTHVLQGTTAPADSRHPAGRLPAATSGIAYGPNSGADLVEMQAQAVKQSATTNQPHPNMMPFGVVNYIVALFGTYPSRQ